MDNEDRATLRAMRNWILGIATGLLVLGGIASVTSKALDLAWFPWQVKMQTGMIRNSNSYITTQQTALRQFMAGYEDAATDGQKTAAVRQMREIADTIPDDVQPDIRSLLSNH